MGSSSCDYFAFLRRSRISIRSSLSVGPDGAAGAAGFLSLLIGFTTKKNIANATMIKLMRIVRNEPYFIATSFQVTPWRFHTSAEKSTFPKANPIAGIIRSSTREVTIFPNAAPITTQTARSTTLPFIANSLNSLSIRIVLIFRE